MKFKSFFSYSNLVFLSVWLFLFIAGKSRLFRDPGTFSHTTIGKMILDTGQFPHTDTFTFTRFGENWIAQQWLGECIMGFVHRLAGFDGLLVLTVSLISLLYALLAIRIDRTRMNLMLGSLVLAVSMAAAGHHFHVRPHLVTMLFLAVLFSILCDIDMKRANCSSLLWLVPVFLIWANIHGGALGGLCTLLITTTAWTFAWRLGYNNPFQSFKRIFRLWMLTLLCFLTSIFNPYFLTLPLTWLKIVGSKATAELIEEHASVLNLLHRGEPTSFITVAIVSCLALFYLSLLVGTNKSDRRVTWFIPMIWLVLSFSRIRHAPLFSVVSVIAIAEMFPYCRWVKSLGNRGLISFQIRNQGKETGNSPRLKCILPAVIVGLTFLSCLGSANLPSTAQRWAKLDPSYWPFEVVPELKTIQQEVPRGTPIFNDMLFGGFLMYHTPGFRVFIDDRCELYGDDFLFRYVKAERSDFDTWTRQYHFNIALLKTDSNYRKYFDDNPDWVVVKRCRAAVLYRKIIP